MDSIKETKEEKNKNILKQYATDLETSVYNLIGNDSNKAYRDKINFLKMRLKTTNYKYFREFLFTNRATTD